MATEGPHFLPQSASVLLTGASGYLGGVVLEALVSQGFEVRALYHASAPNAAQEALPRVEWRQADLLDIYDVASAMQGITHVFHCAAIVSFDPADHQAMLKQNVAATAHVVDEALVQGVSKLVHVSSVAALGRNAATRIITEEAQWEENNRNSAYAQSKLLAEMEVWRAMAEGLDGAVVNPGIILGAPAAHSSARVWQQGSAGLMKLAAKGFPYYTLGRNAFVDVGDVATVMLHLMGSDIQDQRFILSAGNFSYQEVFTAMANALGVAPPHRKAGPILSGLLWRAGALRKALTGKPATITKETARTAQTEALYSNEQILNALPQFRFKSLEQTAQEMAQAYLKATEAGSSNKVLDS